MFKIYSDFKIFIFGKGSNMKIVDIKKVKFSNLKNVRCEKLIKI
jgi:hypothetical protein